MERNKTDVRQVSPLVLAYIGDAIYELLVRTYLLETGILKLNLLHKKTVATVNAVSQSKIISVLDEVLNDEERDIFRRGRNAKTSHVPKGADVIQYRHATGLEAVFGYLYLKNDEKRIRELFNIIMEKTNESK